MSTETTNHLLRTGEGGGGTYEPMDELVQSTTLTHTQVQPPFFFFFFGMEY